MLKLLFSQDLDRLKTRTLNDAHLDENEWRQMLAYSAAVFQNCGNYKAFGDTKFVPELEKDKFRSVVKVADHYETHGEVMNKILDLIEKEIYNEEDPFH